MNDLYLTDEDIHALDEPSWEEQEIERLKKENKELECRLEDKEGCIEMAINKIEWTNFIQVDTVEKLFAYLTELKNILKSEGNMNDSNV